jgi:hypothetical protein
MKLKNLIYIIVSALLTTFPAMHALSTKKSFDELQQERLERIKAIDRSNKLKLQKRIERIEKNPKLLKETTKKTVKKITPEQWFQTEIAPLVRKFTNDKHIAYNPKLIELLSRLFNPNNNIIIDSSTSSVNKPILNAQVQRGINNFVEKMSEKIDDAKPEYQNYLKDKEFVTFDKKNEKSKISADNKSVIIKKLDTAHTWLTDYKKDLESTSDDTTDASASIKKLTKFSTDYFNHTLS